MGTMKIKTLVTAAGVAALIALATLPAAGVTEQYGMASLIAILAIAAGARPVRMRHLKIEMISTQPLILAGLALAGPATAALVGLGGVVGAAIGKRGKGSPVRFVFNLSTVLLATCAAWWTFLMLGGRPGGDIVQLLWPLFGATTALFVVNTGLVSTAIAFEKRQRLLATWRESFHWSTASYFTGMSLAVCLLLIFQSLGPWGLVLWIPPCWLILTFYREHKKRVDEKQRRIDEVEALNADLDSTVTELQRTAAHVKNLQGLIPICMHCKSIRDDKDTWRRLEEYIAAHSDATFTHTLCTKCKEEHYHGVLEKVRT
jgi:hypothetical protein